ncbi:MAG: hypothetical protein ACNA70_04855, partial [Brevefilum sp.]
MNHLDETIEIPQLGVAFNRINRALMTADNEAEWRSSVSAMEAFLNVLARQVISDPDLIGEVHNHSSRAFSMLLSLIATGTQYRLEQFNPKDETGKARRALIDEVYIPLTGQLRQQAIRLAKEYLGAPVFESLRAAIDHEILPLLDSMDYERDPDRWMPFRVVQIGNIYERMIMFRL